MLFRTSTLTLSKMALCATCPGLRIIEGEQLYRKDAADETGAYREEATKKLTVLIVMDFNPG